MKTLTPRQEENAWAIIIACKIVMFITMLVIFCSCTSANATQPATSNASVAPAAPAFQSLEDSKAAYAAETELLCQELHQKHQLQLGKLLHTGSVTTTQLTGTRKLMKAREAAFYRLRYARLHALDEQ